MPGRGVEEEEKDGSRTYVASLGLYLQLTFVRFARLSVILYCKVACDVSSSIGRKGR